MQCPCPSECCPTPQPICKNSQSKTAIMYNACKNIKECACVKIKNTPPISQPSAGEWRRSCCCHLSRHNAADSAEVARPLLVEARHCAASHPVACSSPGRPCAENHCSLEAPAGEVVETPDRRTYVLGSLRACTSATGSISTFREESLSDAHGTCASRLERV